MHVSQPQINTSIYFQLQSAHSKSLSQIFSLLSFFRSSLQKTAAGDDYLRVCYYELLFDITQSNFNHINYEKYSLMELQASKWFDSVLKATSSSLVHNTSNILHILAHEILHGMTHTLWPLTLNLAHDAAWCSVVTLETLLDRLPERPGAFLPCRVEERRKKSLENSREVSSHCHIFSVICCRAARTNYFHHKKWYAGDLFFGKLIV